MCAENCAGGADYFAVITALTWAPRMVAERP